MLVRNEIWRRIPSLMPSPGVGRASRRPPTSPWTRRGVEECAALRATPLARVLTQRADFLRRLGTGRLARSAAAAPLASGHNAWSAIKPACCVSTRPRREEALGQAQTVPTAGLQFRRQYIRSAVYIADFACLERGIVIELDGVSMPNGSRGTRRERSTSPVRASACSASGTRKY